MFSQEQPINITVANDEDEGFGYVVGTLRTVLTQEQRDAGEVGYTEPEWCALTPKDGRPCTVPLKVEHGETIGKWVYTCVENGLLQMHALIDKKTPLGLETWRKVRNGNMPALSIGFKSVPSQASARRINKDLEGSVVKKGRDPVGLIQVFCSEDHPDHNEPASPLMSAPTPSSSEVPSSSSSASAAAAPVSSSPTNANASAPAPASQSVQMPSAPAATSSSQPVSAPVDADAQKSSAVAQVSLLLKDPQNAEALLAMLEDNKKRAQKRSEKIRLTEEAELKKRTDALEKNRSHIAKYAGDAQRAALLNEGMNILAQEEVSRGFVDYTTEVTGRLAETETKLQEQESKLEEMNRLALEQEQELARWRAQAHASQYGIMAPARQPARPPAPSYSAVQERLQALKDSRSAGGNPSALDAQINQQASNPQQSEIARLQSQLAAAMAAEQNTASARPQQHQFQPAEVDNAIQEAAEHQRYTKALENGDTTTSLYELVGMQLKNMFPGIAIQNSAALQNAQDILTKSRAAFDTGNNVLIAGTSQGITPAEAFGPFEQAYYFDHQKLIQAKLRRDPSYLTSKGVKFHNYDTSAGRPELQPLARRYPALTDSQLNARGIIIRPKGQFY